MRHDEEEEEREKRNKEAKSREIGIKCGDSLYVQYDLILSRMTYMKDRI